MNNDRGMGEDERGKRLKNRLKKVRRRKRARRGFECEAVARKMRLARVEEGDGR